MRDGRDDGGSGSAKAGSDKRVDDQIAAVSIPVAGRPSILFSISR
jgi:hypothetical protein